MRGKLGILFSIFLISVTVFIVPLVPALAASKEPIQIGFFGPLTGDNAEYGRHFIEGITLYVEKLNAAGGIQGRPIEIVKEDDRANPKDAANLARRFASDKDIIATIGSFSSTASLAAAPILEQAGLVQLSPSSSHPDFTKQGTYMFRNVNTQAIEGKFNAKMVVNELKDKRVAVLYRQDDWGLTAADSFNSAVKSLGASVVLSEGIVAGTRDFRPLITKLRSLNADAIYIALFYADAAVFTQQMKQAGVKADLVANSSLNNPQFIELGGSAVEGIYVPTNYFPADPSPVVQNFIRQYKQRWNEDPDQFVAIAYDSIAVISEAIKSVLGSSKPLTRQAVRDALYNLPAYRGVSGTINFDTEGDVQKTMTWLVIKNADFTLLNR